MKDFTMDAYKQLLLSIQQSGYSFFTFEDWCDGKATGDYVILRHDVDLKAKNSLAVARIEAELGICATYYFRVVPQSNQPEIILSIAELGHEIGYHYEDLAICGGDTVKAMKHFILQLEYFRNFYPVRTICMHGSPTSKWDNRVLWENNNYREQGIIGEPYLDYLSTLSEIGSKKTYFTDTARMWDGEMYNLRDKSPEHKMKDSEIDSRSPENVTDSIVNLKIHSTFDLISWFKTGSAKPEIMITTHPQRWTNRPGAWMEELIKQNIKNMIKKVIVHRLQLN